MMTERERFEAWARENISRYGFSRVGDSYVNGATHLAWQAWQARCPDGWQCVPKEPTQCQQNAGSVERYHKKGNCEDIYKAMLSAAHTQARKVEMEERKEGWYWVKATNGHPWECCQYETGSGWWIDETGCSRKEGWFPIVGPRIPTPDSDQ